jgi:hypothetical protein
MAMDPTRPVRVCVRFDSPHSVAYRLFQQPPGGQESELATGSSMDANPSCNTGGPFPSGTVIRWFMLIAGNPKTAYRIRIDFEQGGQDVVPPVILSGTTDAGGTANEFGEVAL